MYRDSSTRYPAEGSRGPPCRREARRGVKYQWEDGAAGSGTSGVLGGERGVGTSNCPRGIVALGFPPPLWLPGCVLVLRSSVAFALCVIKQNQVIPSRFLLGYTPEQPNLPERTDNTRRFLIHSLLTSQANAPFPWVV